MNRFIPVALACAIFAAQPVQAATIIRDSDNQATSQNKQTTNTTQNPQAGNEGGPGYEDSKPNTSNNTTNTAGQSQVSAEAKAAADAIAKPTNLRGGRNPLRCDERKSSLREECR